MRGNVANIGSGSVSVIDLKTKQRVANIPSGAGTEGIDVSPDQREVWATNRGGDTASRREVRRIKMPSDASVPVGILVVRTLSRAFIANTNADTVTVIDLKSWQIVDRLTAGKEPDGLGYSPLTL